MGKIQREKSYIDRRIGLFLGPDRAVYLRHSKEATKMSVLSGRGGKADEYFTTFW